MLIIYFGLFLASGYRSKCKKSIFGFIFGFGLSYLRLNKELVSKPIFTVIIDEKCI